MATLQQILGIGGNTATGAVNTVGKTLGAQKMLPFLGNQSPTLSQSANFLTAGKQGVGNKILAGKSTPEDVLNTFLMLSGGAKGEEEIPLKTGKSPVRITLKPSVYGAQREAAVQNTVDNFVPGKTATEKYNNLSPTMEDLGNQINDVMVKNPKNASLDQVMSDYDKNLQNEGVYRTSGVPKDQIQKTARGYINDLQNEAVGESGGNINPSEISDIGLQRIKQQVNQDAQSIYKKIENGTSLSDKDRVILAARQTVDDAITNLHPEVKELTTKQSHLYDAADSLAKARDVEMKAQADQPGFMGKLANMTIKNPAFDILLGATGLHTAQGALGQTSALGGVGIANLMDYIKKISHPSNNQNSSPGQSPNENNQVIHDQSVSNNNTNVNRYALANDPIKTGQLINTSDYAGQKAALQKKIGEETVTNPIQAAQDKGTMDALDTKWNSQSQLRNVWTDPDKGIGNILTVGNTAYQSVNKADPDFFNALNQGYDKLQSASNGKYAQMSKYLQYLGNATGTDFTQYKSKDALIGALDAAMDTTKGRWNTLQQQYNSPTQSLVRQITPQPQQSAQPIQFPKGGFGSTGDLNTGSSLLNGLLQQAGQ